MKLENAAVSNKDTHHHEPEDHTAEIAVAIAVADVVLERMAVMRGGAGASENHHQRNQHTPTTEPATDYSKRSAGGYQSPGVASGGTSVNPTTSSPPNTPPPSLADATRLADALINAALQRGGFDLNGGYGLGASGSLPSTPLPAPQWTGHRAPHQNHSTEKTAPVETHKQSPDRPHELRNREDQGRDPTRLRPEGGELRREDIARAVAQVLSGLADERGPKHTPAPPADKSEQPRLTAEPERTAGEPKPSGPRKEAAQQERPPATSPDVQAILNDPRNDAARLIQQILGNDAANKTPQPQNNELTGRPQPNGPTPNTLEQIPSQHSSIPTMQSSIAAHTDHLRDMLQSVIDRSSPRPPRDVDARPQSQASPVGTTGDYTRVEPPARNAPPQTTCTVKVGLCRHHRTSQTTHPLPDRSMEILAVVTS